MLGVIIGALPLHDGYRHETALPIPIQFSLQAHVALRNGRCHKSDLRQFCETCNGDLLEEAGAAQQNGITCGGNMLGSVKASQVSF